MDSSWNPNIQENMIIKSKITSGTNSGGVVGEFLNNNTLSQTVKFRQNLVIDTTVQATNSDGNAGGLIGNLYQIPSSDIINYDYSLFYGTISNNKNCSECSLVGNIQNMNTGVEFGYGKEINYEEFTNRSKFKQYIGKPLDENSLSYHINSINDLYPFIGVYKFIDLNDEKNYFPVFNENNNSNYPVVNAKDYVLIPYNSTTDIYQNALATSYSSRMLRNYSRISSNPVNLDFDVYASDVNKLNIEFSDVDSDTYFYYKIGDYISSYIPVEKRTYTLTYDFSNPIKIYLTNGFNSKEKTIDSKELVRTIGIINDKTYYINGTSLYSEDKVITGKFKNLYGSDVLTSDGKIYNILNKQETSANINYNILEESKPLYEFTYNGSNIKTYYNYSLVNDVVKELQLFVKNSNLSSINSSLSNKKNMYILDFYNDNEIQIILKDNGKLYSLKNNINYPKNIVNEHIIELYTNINSSDNIAIIKYDNGKVYTFNYRTGELLFDNTSKEKISFMDYIKNKIGNSNSNSIENISGENKYKEIELLKNKIIDISVDEAKDKIYNTNNSTNTDDNYVSVYNEIAQNYELYKVSNLLDESSELKTETNKIYQNYELVHFYKTLGEGKKKNSVSGIVMFSVSIILIIISLVLLIKHKINKKVVSS